MPECGRNVSWIANVLCGVHKTLLGLTGGYKKRRFAYLAFGRGGARSRETISSILFIPGAGAKTYLLERNLAELIFLHFIRETQERSYLVVAIDVRRHAPSEREAARRDVREETLGMDISTIFQLLVAASVEPREDSACDPPAGLRRIPAHGRLRTGRYLSSRRTTRARADCATLKTRGRRVLRAFASPSRPGPAVGVVRKTKMGKTRGVRAFGGSLVPRVPRLDLELGGHYA